MVLLVGLAPLVEDIHGEGDGCQQSCDDGYSQQAEETGVSLSFLACELLFLQVIDGGQLIKLLTLVASIQAVAHDTGTLQVFDGFAEATAHLCCHAT